MKKLLVLVALATLCATSAIAGITNTKHDLSSGSSASVKGTSNEICVYCHTPHGASAAAGAPLWNRGTVAATGSAYQGVDVQATLTTAGINSSDAILCLSCHDGSSLSGTLNNPPNAGGANPTANVTGATNIGTDLSNDHPVGFNYTQTSSDLEIRSTPSNGLKVTYGPVGNQNQMWCSSCHDVHSDANRPFLAFTNAGSALCLSCHNK